MSGKQSVRQTARRAAYQVQQRRREEEAKRERRLTGISVQLMVALRERDDAETRARDAILVLEAEGLNQASIVRWSNGELDAKEVGRLRDFVSRYAEDAGDQSDVGAPKGAKP